MQASEGLIHEQSFISSFIQKDRRERCASLLSNPKRRREFTGILAHFRWLDSQFMEPIPASTAHTSAQLSALLKQRGAGHSVWVISEDRSIDGRTFPLDQAIDAIWGHQMGSVLSCVPGRLAFFRGEEIKSEYLLTHP